MSNFPPQVTTTHVLREEISQLLEEVIPILDTIHKLPFNNEWLSCSPGKYYLQFLIESENFLLWCWQSIENAQIEKLQNDLLSWESEQARNFDGLLNKYYQFYEALNKWRHHQSASEIDEEDVWTSFIYFILITEEHILQHLSNNRAQYNYDELKLVASQYLSLMQKISGFDNHYFCSKLFTFIGIFTKKSYFIPKWTESIPSKQSTFYQKLSTAISWSHLADDYLKIISVKKNNKSI